MATRVAVSRIVRWSAVALCAAATAVGLVACSSDDPTNTDDTAAAGGLQAYIDCLAENGVTLTEGGLGDNGFPGGPPSGQPGQGFPGGFPSGGFPSGFPEGGLPSGFPDGGFPGGGGFGNQPPEGIDEQAWQQAQQACASVRPTGGPGGGPGGGQGNSAVTAYFNCLSENGVTSPALPEQLNTADPTVAAAVQTCEVLRPTAPQPTATP